MNAASRPLHPPIRIAARHCSFVAFFCLLIGFLSSTSLDHARAATPAEHLRELKGLCLRIEDSKPGDTNVLFQWITKKKEFIYYLQDHGEAVGEATNHLRQSMLEEPTPGNTVFVATLLDIIDLADPERFTAAAQAAMVSTNTRTPYKSQILTRIYSSAMITRSNDTAFRQRAAAVTQAAVAAGDRELKISALQYLAGTTFDPFPRKGLDPAAGRKLLREIVENDRLSFPDKEPFLYHLATLDPRYAESYDQNVRKTYLESRPPLPASAKLPFAERLHQLGRFSTAELRTLRETAAKEGPPGASGGKR